MTAAAERGRRAPASADRVAAEDVVILKTDPARSWVVVSVLHEQDERYGGGRRLFRLRNHAGTYPIESVVTGAEIDFETMATIEEIRAGFARPRPKSPRPAAGVRGWGDLPTCPLAATYGIA